MSDSCPTDPTVSLCKLAALPAIPLTTLRRKIGTAFANARRRPLVVTRNKHPQYVLLSAADCEALRCLVEARLDALKRPPPWKHTPAPG